mmetsp:Transcript_104079/g.222332  ORF Transcript_104079/g.222332 Transcript_104079/m.222332 type:complete len:650 (+) Transcript_104079:377-2326(+)
MPLVPEARRRLSLHRLIFAHELHELLPTDLSVVICVDLPHDFHDRIDRLLVDAECGSLALFGKENSNVPSADMAILVVVKEEKGCLAQVLLQVLVSGQRCGDELRVRNVARFVVVKSTKDILHPVSLCLLDIKPHEDLIQFFHSEGARVVRVNGREDVAEPLDFRVAEIPSDDLQSHLLELVHPQELAHLLHHAFLVDVRPIWPTLLLLLFEPLVIVGLERRAPIRRLDTHHPPDESLCGLRNQLPYSPGFELVLSLLHHLQKLELLDMVEGHEAAECHIQYDAARPHVHLLCINQLILLQHLRGDVVGRADLCVHHVLAEVLCGAKIDELQLKLSVVTLILQLLGNEEVFRLHIPMTNGLAVKVAHCAQDLLYDDRSSTLMEVPSLLDGLEKLTSFAKLGGHEDSFLVLKGMVQAHDVGMVQLSHNAHLSPKLFRLDLRLGNRFDGVDLPRLLVRGLAHKPERALAYLLAHVIDLVGATFKVPDLPHARHYGRNRSPGNLSLRIVEKVRRNQRPQGRLAAAEACCLASGNDLSGSALKLRRQGGATPYALPSVRRRQCAACKYLPPALLSCDVWCRRGLGHYANGVRPSRARLDRRRGELGLDRRGTLLQVRGGRCAAPCRALGQLLRCFPGTHRSVGKPRFRILDCC